MRSGPRHAGGKPPFAAKGPSISISGPTLEKLAENAIARARTTVRRSEVLVAACKLLSDHRVMITRCAWCGRYALATHWLEQDEIPAFLPRDLADLATHGICPDCTDDLRRRGLSH